jgi:hypothetical protein
VRNLSFGRPHIDYARRKGHLECVFTVIFPVVFGGHRGELLRRLVDGGIKKSTVYDWYKKWKADRSWRPWDFYKSRGEHNLLFSEDERSEVCEELASMMEKGKMINEPQVCEIMVKIWQIHHPDEEFRVSRPSVYRFLHRCGFGQRRPHAKRRPDVSPIDYDNFVARMKTIFSGNDLHYIINCDETCWWFLPHGLTTWAKRGSKDVKLYHRMNEKQNFTAVASITAANEKLPMQFIAKGKTRRADRGFGEVGENPTTHTLSGWSTVASFKIYLKWLREYKDYGAKKADGSYVHDLILLLDIYKVHKTEEVRELARKLQIELVFIPPGMTDACQPLDRTIFGVLKMKAKNLFRVQFADKDTIKVNREQACALLRQCWGEVSAEALARAWIIYDPASG